ncbi:hypothetical protein TNCV_3366421 [Trichonephila clavipes]|nr:hypothetical protein TNCV_3366421 [Trichonephila clavipes]
MRSGLHLMPSGQTLVLDQESFGLTWHWLDVMSKIRSVKILRSRVNEKIAQFCITVKKRTEVVFPPSARIVARVRRELEEEKVE